MKNPAKKLLDQCSIGYPIGQKIGIAVLGLLYVVSPLDLLPDIIPVVGWGDDVFVLYVIIRVLLSPTVRLSRMGRGADHTTAISCEATEMRP